MNTARIHGAARATSVGRLSRHVAVALGLAAAAARADEGMWTFDAPPLAVLEARHGVALTPAWLEHVRRASVRMSSGGSGSFVSADGLVLTNHHVGSPFIHRLEADHPGLMEEGFLARDRGAELPCRTLVLDVLESIEDVTARVREAVAPGTPPDQAARDRRRVMAAIEQEAVAAADPRDRDRTRCDVVTLHQGGLYHLYRYRTYSDVRLVFAPERQIAAFGGDADNFEFPRYCLDVCLFRAYEDGRPARVPHHLAWARAPAAEGEIVFVSGHPGHTDRGDTVAELVALRDRVIPTRLATVQRIESLLAAWCEEGPEERTQALDALTGTRNARKRLVGMLASLLDPRMLAAKREAEQRLRAAVGSGQDGPFERIAAAEQAIAAVALRHDLLEGAAAFNTSFFRNARTLLRAAAEAARPSGERLREFRDSNRQPLEKQLFADEPLFDPLETAKLADSLTFLATTLGADDPLVTAVLAGQSPRDRAAALVAGTALGRRPAAPGVAPPPDRRRELYAGGAAAVAASSDPMLALARLVDDEARALRKQVEAAEETKRQAHAELARARFAQDGAAVYPDATFTLRLAFGPVRGVEIDGRRIEPATTYRGLFARAAAKREQPPFDLPPRWREVGQRAGAAFLDTPFNFVSTADIIGGNSGSPVVNRAGELVGVIFDGNIESLALDVAYEDKRARAVAVAAAGIVAALETVYDAQDLVAEMRAAGDDRERRP
jgi:hypothetical protein